MGRGADQHVTLAAGGVPQDRHEALVAERLDPGLALANHALGMSALLRADEEPLRVNASDQPETGYAALPTSRPAQLRVAEAPVGAPAAAPVGAGASGSGGDAPTPLPRRRGRWALVSGGAAAADCPGLVGSYALAAHATGRNRHAVRPPAYWQSAIDRRAPPVGAPAALLGQGGAGWGWARDRCKGRGGGQVAGAGGRHAPGRVCYAVSQSKSSWARRR